MVMVDAENDRHETVWHADGSHLCRIKQKDVEQSCGSGTNTEYKFMPTTKAAVNRTFTVETVVVELAEARDPWQRPPR